MRYDKTLLAFCLKVTLLITILFGVDKIVGLAFVQMKNVGLERNPENLWLKTPFTVEKVDADVVVIGSSKAIHNYIPDSISKAYQMTAYNCGQDGCFFLYQNCIINMVLDRYKPKVILWDIQPNSFTKANVADEYQNIRYLTPYYHQNKWAKEYIGSESAKMPVRMLSCMYGYNSKLLNYVFPLITHASATKNGYVPLENTGYAYPQMTREPQTTDGKLSGEYLTLLDMTLKRCRKANIDIRLYISPVYSVKDNLTKQAENAIMRVAEKNEVCLYNYHSDVAFMRDSTFFKDNGHLNDKGARWFAKYIE